MYITALLNISVQEKKKDTVSVCNTCIIKVDAAAVQSIVETLKIMIMKTKEGEKPYQIILMKKYTIVIRNSTLYTKLWAYLRLSDILVKILGNGREEVLGICHSISADEYSLQCPNVVPLCSDTGAISSCSLLFSMSLLANFISTTMRKRQQHCYYSRCHTFRNLFVLKQYRSCYHSSLIQCVQCWLYHYL